MSRRAARRSGSTSGSRKRLDAEYEQRMKADPKGYRHSGEAALNRERVEAGPGRDRAPEDDAAGGADLR